MGWNEKLRVLARRVRTMLRAESLVLRGGACVHVCVFTVALYILEVNLGQNRGDGVGVTME